MPSLHAQPNQGPPKHHPRSLGFSRFSRVSCVVSVSPGAPDEAANTVTVASEGAGGADDCRRSLPAAQALHGVVVVGKHAVAFSWHGEKARADSAATRARVAELIGPVDATTAVEAGTEFNDGTVGALGRGEIKALPITRKATAYVFCVDIVTERERDRKSVRGR